MKMSHLASKLKTLRLELSEYLIVHLVLISLPTQLSQFKVGTTVKRTSAPFMSSYHIVCKKRKG